MEFGASMSDSVVQQKAPKKRYIGCSRFSNVHIQL